MAQKTTSIIIGSEVTQEVAVLPRMANRHGLVAGATEHGQTVTLRLIAEQFQRHRRAGLPGRREGRPVRHGEARRRPAGAGCAGKAARPS